MLWLWPTRPDLCQHDSGFLRLHHLLRDPVSVLLTLRQPSLLSAVPPGEDEAPPPSGCRSGTVSSLAGGEVRTGNVEVQPQAVGLGSVLQTAVCLHLLFITTCSGRWNLGVWLDSRQGWHACIVGFLWFLCGKRLSRWRILMFVLLDRPKSKLKHTLRCIWSPVCFHYEITACKLLDEADMSRVLFRVLVLMDQNQCGVVQTLIQWLNDLFKFCRRLLILSSGSAAGSIWGFC